MRGESLESIPNARGRLHLAGGGVKLFLDPVDLERIGYEHRRVDILFEVLQEAQALTRREHACKTIVSVP